MAADQSFKALAEAAGDAIITSGAEDVILYANPATERIFGYGREELTKMALTALMPERFRKYHLAGVQRFLQSGEAHVIGRTTVELAGLRRSGEEFPLELSLGHWKDGEDHRFTAILRDITERKAAERALRREMVAVKLLESVAMASNESNSFEQAISSCLTAVCEATGWPLGHAFLIERKNSDIHLVPSGLWHVESSSSYEEFIRLTNATRLTPGIGLPGRVLIAGKAQWISDILQDSDFPRARPLAELNLRAAFAFPVLVGSEMVAVLEFFSPVPQEPDLSMLDVMNHVGVQVGRVFERERRTAEKEASARQLQELNAQLEMRVAERTVQLEAARDDALQASRAKSSFLANMSHELRTPLNAIIGYSEMLLEESADLETQRLLSDLTRIHAAGNHLLLLISDILDLSKIEAGKVEIHIDQFDLCPLVEELTATVQPLVEKRSNTLTVQCATDLGAMLADELKVRQILYNLLSNAAKFTEGGTITLEVEKTTEGGETSIIFRVSDSGIGMSEQQMALLFREFTQIDPSTTRRHGGTGLGLAISRHFCRLMGGEITVSSQKGVGSVFTAKIPTSIKASTGI